MEKFKVPQNMEEFMERIKSEKPNSIQNLIKALKDQRNMKVKALDEEIKYLEEVHAYYADGTVPERFQ